MNKFQAPRGTHDVLPRDHLWWRVVRTIEEQCAQYGWSRVSTPGFEDTGLFERTSGEASDVVHKEMYSFVDRGDRSLTLRPEGTAPIARAYVEHGLAQEPQPVKAYAIAPMYRYSRPGRGRYREHWQLSLEVIGSADPAVDAEVIQFYSELLRRLGVTDWELRLNSIGDENCRPQYVARLNEWLDAHPELVDEEVAHKRATSVLQVFDVKNPQVLAALADAPKIGEALCDSCHGHFDKVKADLDQYADLPTDVLGLTRFTPGKPPVVSINAELTGPVDSDAATPGQLGRWRATLAHEAAHVFLHRYLFEPDLNQMQLFDPPSAGPLAKGGLMRCLKRDVGQATGSKDWREVQANRGMAALLMPRATFKRAAFQRIGAHSLTDLTVGSPAADILAAELAGLFSVSKQAATIRLETVGIARAMGNAGLLPGL